jgi:hypothetical protein
LAFSVVVGLRAFAQETIGSTDRAKFDEYRRGEKPVGDPASKDVLEKFARDFVGKLKDSEWQNGTDPNGKSMEKLFRDFERLLQLQASNIPAAVNFFKNLRPNQKPFYEEFGKVMVAALENDALANAKPIVRVNAARMNAEVCRTGYDGAAALCIKILAKPEETDGFRESARLYALKGLNNLFAIVPDPIVPEKTVFQKLNNGQLTDLERASIKTLIDYITRKPITDPNINPEALQYIRREAIRALGRVRVQAVKNNNQVESRPALILLRVAQGEGLNPPPSAYERAEALIGFCRLKHDLDREMRLDYAAFHIGQALDKIAQKRVENPQDQSVPWKDLAEVLGDALNTWQADAGKIAGLDHTNVAKDLYQTADGNVFRSLKEGNAAIQPNLEQLRKWLTDHPPTSKSLFKSDATTTVTPPAQ